jgi:hypothetical protein
MLLDVQRQAEDLARHAGNAAAAARMALARTGDLRSLEIVAPTGPEMVARDVLAQAKQRLQLLAAAWAELDPTGAIASELISSHPQERLPAPPVRRRRRT